MQFELPQETWDLTRELRRWVDEKSQRARPGSEPFEPSRWLDFQRWGLLSRELSDADCTLTTAAAFIEVGRGGLPGPVLEAYLAVASGNADAADRLTQGLVVSSIGPRRAGVRMVGWGAVAEMVVDQLSGAVLAAGPLPQAELAYRLPHGWYEADRDAQEPDQLRLQRWVGAAALLTGLSIGAIELTSAYVATREQFGRPLAAFQAVQLPLAEVFAYAEGMRLCTLDAAWRVSVGDPRAAEAAALAWLWTSRAASQVADVCHQAFGAAGFCDEVGLTYYTWQMAWLRLSIGSGTAREHVLARRNAGGERHPPSLILSGFGPGPELSPVTPRSA